MKIYFILIEFKYNFILIEWGLGIGDWGLGIGDWAQSAIPNPQSPIPNPHFHLKIENYILIIIIFKKVIYNIYL